MNVQVLPHLGLLVIDLTPAELKFIRWDKDVDTVYEDQLV